MLFKKTKLIRFHHCDPAGIVFYPQYLVLCNELVEDWLSEAYSIGLEVLIHEHKRGLPMRHLEAEFLSPSHHGEELEFQLRVEHIGNTSLRLRIYAMGANGLRFFSRQTVIWSDVKGPKPTPIEAAWRERFELFLEPIDDQEVKQ